MRLSAHRPASEPGVGSPRETLKAALALMSSPRPAQGATLLIYHRVGGGSVDERDLATDRFDAQLDELTGHEVVSIEEAADRLGRGDERPSFVLTFDDGFGDVYEHAWPRLRERGLPFTLYLTTAYVGGEMRWDGSTATAAGHALTWPQLDEMVASGLCTIGNHTHTHARPERLTAEELDRCTAEVEQRLGVRPQHFAYTWGVPVPAMATDLRARFRTAATGHVGRNRTGDDPMTWHRVPVRRTDPLAFFRAKLTGGLAAETAYDVVVRTAKRAGLRA